jgi:hypothetical protein
MKGTIKKITTKTALVLINDGDKFAIGGTPVYVPLSAVDNKTIGAEVDFPNTKIVDWKSTELTTGETVMLKRLSAV